MPNIHIFDGAMGTMLQAGGLAPGACPELMNVQHPEVVQEIHRKYLEAGSTYIETNTFGATGLKLEHYGLAERVAELNGAAVENARAAIRDFARAAEEAGRPLTCLPRVAGSMGPTGRFIAPLGDLDFEEAYAAYRQQASALAAAGADALIIETCIDVQEMRAALLAAKEVTDIPIICQMSYSEDGRTVTGTDPETAAVTLAALGADIIGINCSLGPSELVPLVEILARSCNCPISVQPNAGLPRLEKGHTIFPMGPEDFAAWGPKLVAAGATYLGGCCGTTPEHIRALAEAVRELPLPERQPVPPRLRLTSRSRTVTIDKSLPTVLIGERINPTGRKKLAAELLSGSFLSVKKEAVEQTKAGAQVLDVNMGAAGLPQAPAMGRAVQEISQLVATPLAIDTSDPEALEAGLRAYPGRALVNSVSAEPERLEKFLPLAKKYGAAILCLPLTEAGVPQTARERLEVARTIIKAAKESGLKEGDFLLDALVMTISADQRACLEVLSTLQMYRETFGYPATMGLSNISFGLPNRPLINSTFFAMSLAAGLDAPIMNPYDSTMQKALLAAAALLGKDPQGLAYSRDEGNLALGKAPAPQPAPSIPKDDTLGAIRQAVIEGAKEAVVPLVEQAIAQGKGTDEITARGLTAAMEAIGADFGAGRVFLPQVLLSAETMRTAFDTLKQLLPAQQGPDKGTVVMATVKGDVHDLGKNIVGALLSNSGFRLVDLGKDVPAETIVREALAQDADIVGLCALMTTTMTQIDTVVAALHAAGSRAKIMVGGAAVTQEYADQAGADAYASDGVQAVKLAEEMVAK